MNKHHNMYKVIDLFICSGSSNGVGRINEVTLRRARLVLGWMTCPGSTPGGGTLFLYVMLPATQVDSAFHPFEVDKLSLSCN